MSQLLNAECTGCETAFVSTAPIPGGIKNASAILATKLAAGDQVGGNLHLPTQPSDTHHLEF